MDAMSRLTFRTKLAVFLRAFLIQGSWNNRRMVGGGFGFALLPVLREVFRGQEETLNEAAQRHSEHFNSHPYMANLALGAVSRMEERGADPEEIRRFKIAVRGPLGSLGDALIWAGWRPAVVLAGLTLALLGASPEWTVLFFLIVYNLGHLALRTWGFRTGLAQGSDVGGALRFLSIPRQADRISGIGVFLLAVVAGLVLGRGLTAHLEMALWIGPAAFGLWLGSRVGQKAFKPLVRCVAALMIVIFLVGWLG
jgi:PTS system mannose-specific IID component